MRPITREEYPLDTLQRLVNGVTFFKELIQANSSQFELLMSASQFVTADPHEVILKQGDNANLLYFLVKGNLSVLAEDNATVLNEINAGEVFGVMAMVLNDKRSASVRVGNRPALLASIDYQHFRDMDDFSLFNLATKISFFRMVNNHIRWHLEQKKMQNSNHPFVARLRTLPIYNGPKDVHEELFFLQQQAHLQALLLCEWNDHHNML